MSELYTLVASWERRDESLSALLGEAGAQLRHAELIVVPELPGVTVEQLQGFTRDITYVALKQFPFQYVLTPRNAGFLAVPVLHSPLDIARTAREWFLRTAADTTGADELELYFRTSLMLPKQ